MQEASQELKSSLFRLFSQPIFFSQIIYFLRYRDCIKLCNTNKHFRTLALQDSNVKRAILHQLIIENFHEHIRNDIKHFSLVFFREISKNDIIYFEITALYQQMQVKEIDFFEKIISKGIDEDWCYTNRICAKNLIVGDILQRKGIESTLYHTEIINPVYLQYIRYEIANQETHFLNDINIKNIVKNPVNEFPFMNDLTPKTRQERKKGKDSSQNSFTIRNLAKSVIKHTFKNILPTKNK
jgi:hypothetical protein